MNDAAKNEKANPTPQTWLTSEGCCLADFTQQLQSASLAVDMPLADAVESSIPLYQAERIVNSLSSGETINEYLAEWVQVFSQGAGIICIKGAYTDTSLLDRVRDVLFSIIESERTSSAGTGDHFAAAGENDRLWNAHEKLSVASPELFIHYNANPIVPLVSRAWLGPYYQITTQVNVVHPGGKAQVCHRDYHMGFQNSDTLERYPAHIHALSPQLTLQGAIAHSDMPIASGPTQLLPGSQRYLPGYMAAQRQDFRDYFNANYVQLPLQKGDALFFNPAVFHAAGENRTDDCQRFANLLQIGSGYARSIETVDRVRVCAAVYPALIRAIKAGELTDYAIDDVMAACAEGYPFPTNLDIDSPLGGMVPQSQLELMQEAVAQEWTDTELVVALDEQKRNQRSH